MKRAVQRNVKKIHCVIIELTTKLLNKISGSKDFKRESLKEQQRAFDSVFKDLFERGEALEMMENAVNWLTDKLGIRVMYVI